MRRVMKSSRKRALQGPRNGSTAQNYSHVALVWIQSVSFLNTAIEASIVGLLRMIMLECTRYPEATSHSQGPHITNMGPAFAFLYRRSWSGFPRGSDPG